MSRTYGDRADATDKVQVLKNKIESLKKEVARLRKELNKAMQRLSENTRPVQEVAEKKPDTELHCDSDSCTKGIYEVFHLKLGNGDSKTYLTCNLCGHRKVIK